MIQELPTIRENEPFLPEEDPRLRPVPITPVTATPDESISGDTTPTSLSSSQPPAVEEKTGALIETAASIDSGVGKRVKVSEVRRGKTSSTPSEDSEQSQPKVLRNSELLPSRLAGSSSSTRWLEAPEAPGRWRPESAATSEAAENLEDVGYWAQVPDDIKRSSHA